jgi:hypothetical protein
MAGSCRRGWVGGKVTNRMQKWERVDRRLSRAIRWNCSADEPSAFVRVPLRSMLARSSLVSEKLQIMHGGLAVVFGSEVVFTISKVEKELCMNDAGSGT